MAGNEDWLDELDKLADGAEETTDSSDQPVHGNAVDFFESYFRHVYKRRVGIRNQYRWSARWWENPEALIRVDAVWRAWESLSADPSTGMSSWLRDHADYHMGILLSPDGPMGGAEDQNQAGEPLPHDPPPPGQFPDVRDR
ncbi:DUF4913 domain-containing protein [Nocardiopsis sp. NPDC050513]|uniref:DUF4913 domain-containing protein n=1 Tax=Nocardiopsis sp. NPDC050513 TaxID=3364338 RepID=UPI003788989C